MVLAIVVYIMNFYSETIIVGHVIWKKKKNEKG